MHLKDELVPLKSPFEFSPTGSNVLFLCMEEWRCEQRESATICSVNR